MSGQGEQVESVVDVHRRLSVLGLIEMPGQRRPVGVQRLGKFMHLRCQLPVGPKSEIHDNPGLSSKDRDSKRSPEGQCVDIKHLPQVVNIVSRSEGVYGVHDGLFDGVGLMS